MSEWHVSCSALGGMMPTRARSALAIAWAMTVAAPSAALAEDAGSGPSITQAQTAPDRFLNYNQPDQETLGTSTRSIGLNPTGVNYSDCISDMTLGFPVVLSGFGSGNADGMQIWASALGTCIADVDRGNPPGAPRCWLVNNGFPLGSSSSVNGSQEFYVRVQDIVGPQQAPPNPPYLVHEGASACSAQPSSAAVDIFLWFVPLMAEATYDPNATALKWKLSTDLVGPSPPTGLTVGAGDSLLIAQWTANADPDTFGYDVFIDPPPGSPAQLAQTQIVCATSSGSGSAGTSSSASSNAADAACHAVNVAESAPSLNTCSSAVLGSATAEDGGGAPVEDDAGDDAAPSGALEGGVTSGIGGISSIPCQYAVDVGCPSGSPIYTENQQITVASETGAQFQISNLVNGVTYAVAVSAVDSSGNPGPATSPMCNYPAPVNDFYEVYRDAGGAAGGGFCALQGGTKLDASTGSPIGSWIPLATAGVAVLAAGRRRRPRRRR